MAHEDSSFGLQNNWSLPAPPSTALNCYRAGTDQSCPIETAGLYPICKGSCASKQLKIVLKKSLATSGFITKMGIGRVF